MAYAEQRRLSAKHFGNLNGGFVGGSSRPKVSHSQSGFCTASSDTTCRSPSAKPPAATRPNFCQSQQRASVSKAALVKAAICRLLKFAKAGRLSRPRQKSTPSQLEFQSSTSTARAFIPASLAACWHAGNPALRISWRTSSSVSHWQPRGAQIASGTG